MYPMPLAAAFLEFLRTGLFYGVGIGLQLKDVQAQLGLEEKRWESDHMLTLHWHWPPVSLTFDPETQLLWLLEIDLKTPELITTLFGYLENFSPATIEKYLELHDISYQVRPAPLATGNELEFQLPHAIEFAFWDDPDEGEPLALKVISQKNTLLPHLIITRL